MKRIALLLLPFGLAATSFAGALGRVDAPPTAPQPYLRLDAGQQQAFDFGHAVFNTHFVAAGTPDAERIDGLGPLFNAPSCDACHNEGARGRGPERDGELPVALVIQLSAPGGEDAGDPVYGHVFNTASIEGFAPEGVVRVRYQPREGRYADGTPWQLRVPQYSLASLRYGALADGTVLKPRLAPALYGAGLLERVPLDWLKRRERQQARAGLRGHLAWHVFDGQRAPGRFGWQDDAISIHDQTSRAFAREMGLTNRMRPADDCTEAEADCRAAPSGGTPEVPREFHVLIGFQRWLGVPLAPAAGINPQRGTALFRSAGCADCHVPALPVQLEDGRRAVIEAYTDLLLHDLGQDLADHDATGRSVPGAWRTAPLWGLGLAARDGRAYSLLHDGRARSIAEAVLWHGGEAGAARERFARLDAAERKTLEDWLAAR
jgi:CxxC motif-containing protein (DUF1111 family)